MTTIVKMTLALTLVFTSVAFDGSTETKHSNNKILRKQRRLIPAVAALGLGAVGGVVAGEIIGKLFGNLKESKFKTQEVSLDYNMERGQMLQLTVDKTQTVDSINRLRNRITNEFSSFERDMLNKIGSIKMELAVSGELQMKKMKQIERD